MAEYEVVAAVIAEDFDALISEMASLSEKERAPIVNTLKSLDELTWGYDRVEEAARLPELQPFCDLIEEHGLGAPHAAINMALLGTGNARDATSTSLFYFEPEHNGFLLSIFRDRRPKWLAAWVKKNYLLRRRSQYFVGWEVLHGLIAEGIVPKPTEEGYYHALSAGVSAYHMNSRDPNWPTISEFFRRNPQLLPDVWHLFERETWGFLDTPGHGYIHGPKEAWARENWGKALHVLSEEGIVDRQRLLDVTLDSIQRDIATKRTACLIELHDKLAPSTKELATRVKSYLALLGAASERCAAFAMKWLAKIETAKAMDDGGFVREADRMLACSGKALVTKGVKILAAIAARNPAMGVEIQQHLVEVGMIHPKKDVQEVVLKVLEKGDGLMEEATRSLLEARLDEVSPSLRHRAAALCRTGGTDGDDEDRGAEAAEAPLTEFSEFPECWKKPAGVEEAARAVAQGEMPPALSFAIMDVPVTSGLEPVLPITTIDEIFDVLSQGARSALDHERLMDAFSRIEPDISEAFDRMAAPLIEHFGVSFAFASLATTWLTRGEIELEPEGHSRLVRPYIGMSKGGTPGLPLSDTLEQRIIEIRERLRAGVTAPVLSMPTHHGYWVLATELVTRCNAYTDATREIPRFDLILALLRLAPEGRDVAANHLVKSDSLGVRAIQWTLTGVGRAEADDDPAIWLAAARARNPYGAEVAPGVDLSLLEGPDGATPTCFSLMPEEERTRFSNQWEASIACRQDVEQRAWIYGRQAIKDHTSSEESYGSPKWLAVEREKALINDEARLPYTPHGLLQHRLAIAIENPWCKTLDYDARPTLQLHNLDYGVPHPKGLDMKFESTVREGTLIWPLNADPANMVGLVSITTSLGKKTKSWPEHVCLENLHEPDRPISLMGSVLMVLSLSAPAGDLQRAAIDVMIAAIDDGRAHPDVLAPALTHLNSTEYLNLKRLAAGMVEVAQVSSQHTWVMAALFDAFIASWAVHPKGANVVLEPLLEWKTVLGQTLSLEARKTLETLKATGKGVKAVKQLLALKENPGGTWKEVPSAMLAARVARAERWAGATV